jgi:hypothetical protein
MLADHFQIPNAGAHRALADAQALALLLPHLLRLAAQQHSRDAARHPVLLPTSLAAVQPHPRLVRYPPPLLGMPPRQHQAVQAALAALAEQRCGACGACAQAPAAGAMQQQRPCACAPVLLTPEEFCAGVRGGWVAAARSPGGGEGKVAYFDIRSSGPGAGAAGSSGGGAARPVRLLLQDVAVSTELEAGYHAERDAARAGFNLHLSCSGELLLRLAAALHFLAAGACDSLGGQGVAARRLRSNLGADDSLLVKLEGRAVVSGSGVSEPLRGGLPGSGGGQVVLRLAAPVFRVAAGGAGSDGGGGAAVRSRQQAEALQRVDASCLGVDCERQVHRGLLELLPLGAWCHCVAEPRCVWVDNSSYGVKLVATHLCLASSTE